MTIARQGRKLHCSFWPIFSKLFVVAGLLVAGALFPAQSAPRDSWKLTCYAFRDINRNGVFDMGDRPYAALPIQIARPDGRKILRKSNIDGFANFVVKLGATKTAHIPTPGNYTIQIKLPDGWKSTSKYGTQTLKMEVRPNAPGGMFVADTCIPIGVAPILKISGRFSPAEDSQLADHEISLTDDAGKQYDLPFDASGNFEFVGYPGNWLLALKDFKRNISHVEKFKVENNPVVLGQINLKNEPPSPNDRVLETVYFDDLTVSDALFEIPSGYHGLNWRNWISVHNRFYKGAGYINSTISSEYVAYNSSGTPAVIWNTEPFDFEGTYIGLAWPRGEEDDVIVRAWKDGELTHEDRLRLSNAGPVYFAANYRDVTRIEISSGIYERITLDDFSFRK